MRRSLTFCLLLIVANCGGAPPQDASLVLSSDPELGALAAELLPEVSRRAGLELHRPVRLELRSREHLVSYLTAKLDEDLPPERADYLARSYGLLGLVPPGIDLRALLMSVYTEQVAGFYDPDSVALFVLDDYPRDALRTVLLHELVHAVQDQSHDLEALTDPALGSDRQTAAQAAIEGHATLVMLEYALERAQGAAVDLSTLDGFGEQLRGALGSVGSQFPALAGAPRVIRESLLFPYLEGAGFVQQLWRRQGGRTPPFGEYLPESTEQILEPERSGAPGHDPPQELRLRVPSNDVLHSDVLGALEVALLLEELSGSSETRQAPLGWRGDRFVLTEGPGGDALAWVSLWDDAFARERFKGRLAPLIPRFPRPATLEELEVEGAPALLLRIGEIGAVEVELVGPR